MDALKTFFISLFKYETLGWVLISNIVQIFAQRRNNEKTKKKNIIQDILSDLDHYIAGLPEMMEIADDVYCDFYKRSINGIELMLSKYDKATDKSERDSFKEILRTANVDQQITKCRQLLVKIRQNLKTIYYK